MQPRITSEVTPTIVGATAVCALITLLAVGSAYAGPQIVLDVMQYETDLLTGEIGDFTLNVANPGDETRQRTVGKIAFGDRQMDTAARQQRAYPREIATLVHIWPGRTGCRDRIR